MSEERAIAAAEALGLAYEATPIPRVRSLDEAATALGIEPRQIAKSLVVRIGNGEDRDYRIVLVPGDRQIAWPKLRAVLGVNRASMPSADEAFEVTGFERGTIGPLGTTKPWPVVIDAEVTGRINVGSGAHGTGLMVDAAELAAAVGATVADVSEALAD